MLVTKETDDFIVSYEDNKKIRDNVFKSVIEYYFKHNSFDGESICQNDNPIIEAHQVLAEIADNIIKFKVEYNNE